MKVNVEQPFNCFEGERLYARGKVSYAVLTVEKSLDLHDIHTEEPADATLPSLTEKLGVSRTRHSGCWPPLRLGGWWNGPKCFRWNLAMPELKPFASK